jgi:signal transduction histidine kinase
MLSVHFNSDHPGMMQKHPKVRWGLREQNIREEERIRIAREIHDELGQWLTALKVEVFLIKKTVSAEDQAVQLQLSSMIALVMETEKAVDRIAIELRPGILSSLGLLAALEWHGGELERRTGIQLQISSSGDLNLETNLSTGIFRVYQEALTNIVRHANATKVDVAIKQKNNYVILTIKDNGQGFDLSEIRAKDSLGLIGMRERALMFDGELHVESSRSNGTVVELKIPLI